MTGSGESMRVRPKRNRWALATAGLLTLAIAAYGTPFAATLGFGIRIPQSSSWAFDLSDPAQVAGYTDYVVIGTVIDMLDTSAERSTFLVRVDDSLDAKLTGDIKVSQSAGRVGSAIFEDSDQPLLKVGDKYILALSVEAPDSDTLGLLSGPLSGQPVADRSAAPAAALIAAGNGSFPPGFRKGLASERDAARTAWEIERPESIAPTPTTPG